MLSYNDITPFHWYAFISMCFSWLLYLPVLFVSDDSYIFACINYKPEFWCVWAKWRFVCLFVFLLYMFSQKFNKHKQKSVHKCLSYFTDRQTNAGKNRTSLVEVIIYLSSLNSTWGLHIELIRFKKEKWTFQCSNARLRPLPWCCRHSPVCVWKQLHNNWETVSNKFQNLIYPYLKTSWWHVDALAAQIYKADFIFSWKRLMRKGERS